MGAVLLLIAGPALAQPAAQPPARRPAAQVQPASTARLAVLDKRSGTVTDLTLKPGETFTVGQLTGVLRACQQTPPHERRETAAYVELSSLPRPAAGGAPARPRRLFAGWLFAESPSLNPFAHPAYDVWLRACTIPAPVTPPASVPTGPKAVQSASRASESASSER